jgi:putative DNA primase/helicase
MNTDMKKPTGGGNPTAGNTDAAIVARDHAAAPVLDKELATMQAVFAMRGQTLHRQADDGAGGLYAARWGHARLLPTPDDARPILEQSGGTAVSGAVEQFRDAIAAAGLPAPETIHGDGVIHRFNTSGRHGDDSGWYVLHMDGVPAGAFGDWRQGLQSTWSAVSDHRMTQAERLAHRQRAQAMQAQRDADVLEGQESAAVQAARGWAGAINDSGMHPYLMAKGIQSHGARVDGDGFLLVPMRDTDGKLWNIERINPQDFRDKRGLPGGRRKGCYFGIGKPTGSLVVAEGFATGASIHEATGHAVAVAFNAGNLLPVATALRGKYPSLRIILAADDDWRTAGNPGMTQATAAAQAVSGWLAVPSFPAQRPDKATDFNDLQALCGADAVHQCIEQAQQTGNGPAGVLSEEWPIPAPLPDALPAVQPFDSELLPAALRDWIMDIAHRMQCPPDFPAVGALVALSSLIGARAVIQPKVRDDWQVVPNLWGACVGRPGVKKSPALGEALKPINRLQVAERERWQGLHEAWALDAKVSELAQADREKKAKVLASKDPAQARALLQSDGDGEPEPVQRRFIVNDATVEKLGELLAVNPWGTLSFRDELYGLLTSMDKQGQEGARAFYLQAFDGNGAYTFDRILRGTVHIPRVCLAMVGGIQPGRIQDYVRGAVAGGSDDGLLQRFGLTVWPDTRGDYLHVDQWPDTPAKQRAWEVFERLAQLKPGDDDEPTVWRFSPEAQALFADWLVPFETELRREDLHPALVSHLAKYRKLIPALALIFAMIDTQKSGGIVGEQELVRALAWGDYLRTHAERLYAAAVVPESAGARTLLAKVKAGRLADAQGVLLDAFTPRQVAQKGWTGLATPEAVRKAADLLADWDYLRAEVVQSAGFGGRPSERYRINPRVFDGGAA